MKDTSKEHVDALRTLGKSLNREQMYICFDAANELASTRDRLEGEIKHFQELERVQWQRFCEQMKRADELNAEIDRLKFLVKRQ